jgi:hypothetical protein
MFKSRKPFVRVGACLLGGDGEQGCNAADWVRGMGMQILPTYPLQ